MPRITLLLLAFPALVSVVTAAPVPKEDDRETYHPTRVGAKWVYEYSGGGELVTTVTKVETRGREKVVTVGQLGEGGAVTPHATMRVAPGGLFLVEMGADAPGALSPPKCELKLPPKGGDRWEVGPYGLRDGPLGGEKYEYANKGVEAVTVPAGTYKAVRVEQNRVLAGGRVVWRYTTWFAPGVGMVKLASDTSSRPDRPRRSEAVLKSFVPGGD